MSILSCSKYYNIIILHVKKSNFWMALGKHVHRTRSFKKRSSKSITRIKKYKTVYFIWFWNNSNKSLRLLTTGERGKGVKYSHWSTEDCPRYLKYSLMLCAYTKPEDRVVYRWCRYAAGVASKTTKLLRLEWKSQRQKEREITLHNQAIMALIQWYTKNKATLFS